MADLLIGVFTVDILFTFCCGTCDVSTLVGMTLHNICITPMITFELAAFYYFNITFLRFKGNTIFDKDAFINNVTFLIIV